MSCGVLKMELGKEKGEEFLCWESGQDRIKVLEYASHDMNHGSPVAVPEL